MADNATRRPGRAPDPRPARTRAALLEAIERLSAVDQEVSVSMIVREAQVSRSSFYSQFKDVGDVAVQLISQLYQSDDLPTDSSPAAGINHSIRALVNELSSRRNLYTKILGNTAEVSVLREVCEVLTQQILHSIASIVPESIHPAVAAKYIASGYLVTLVDWLCAEWNESIDALETQLHHMLPLWVLEAE